MGTPKLNDENWEGLTANYVKHCKSNWQVPNLQNFAQFINVSDRYFHKRGNKSEEKMRRGMRYRQRITDRFEQATEEMVLDAYEQTYELAYSKGKPPTLKEVSKSTGIEYRWLKSPRTEYQQRLACGVRFARLLLPWDGVLKESPASSIIHGKQTIKNRRSLEIIESHRVKQCPRCRKMDILKPEGPYGKKLCPGCIDEWHEIVSNDRGVLAS